MACFLCLGQVGHHGGGLQDVGEVHAEAVAGGIAFEADGRYQEGLSAVSVL